MCVCDVLYMYMYIYMHVSVHLDILLYSIWV